MECATALRSAVDVLEGREYLVVEIFGAFDAVPRSFLVFEGEQRRRGYQQLGGYFLTKGDLGLDTPLRMDADALRASASFPVGTF